MNRHPTCYGEVANLLWTCYGLVVYVVDLLQGSRQLVTDLLWGNWCNGFWALVSKLISPSISQLVNR